MTDIIKGTSKSVYLFTNVLPCPRNYLRWLIGIKFFKIQNTINKGWQITFMLHETLSVVSGGPEDDAEKALAVYLAAH